MLKLKNTLSSNSSLKFFAPMYMYNSTNLFFTVKPVHLFSTINTPSASAQKTPEKPAELVRVSQKEMEEILVQAEATAHPPIVFRPQAPIKNSRVSAKEMEDILADTEGRKKHFSVY